ncbi:MAG TPA: methyltetrahydrofolate cobalamin methyltransferase [Candidatus Omnitrophica bacterium]|nr:methyltetrahydrofolate cobalamin methyltransferase [Candidatus Omnitrophota bacterium]
MFTVIGERINMTRKRIREEVWARNEEFIRSEAEKQQKAGATHIDLNAGGDPKKEVEDMGWLTKVVSDATDLPLVFDSTNERAIEEGLKICNRDGTIINSITGEKERIEKFLPLLNRYRTSVIVLTMDDKGMPEDYQRRMEITREMIKLLEGEGIQQERIYIDHLVRPISTSPQQARFILEAIRATKEEFPSIHIALGLSNISFGLPQRNSLNRAFLAMLIAAGCDGAIIDPTEPGMMKTLFSSRAVAGVDEYGMEYISAYRENKLR